MNKFTFEYEFYTGRVWRNGGHYNDAAHETRTLSARSFDIAQEIAHAYATRLLARWNCDEVKYQELTLDATHVCVATRNQ